MRNFLTLGGSLCISLALAQTPALRLETALQSLPQTPAWRLAELNYQASQRALESARAGDGFQLSGHTNYTRTNPIESPLPGQSTLRVGANAKVGVLPWSATVDSARAAARNLEQANLSRQEARNSLVINLHTLYFALRLASQDREIAQNTLKLRETQMRAVTVQNQNGQASRKAILQAQQTLEQAQLAQEALGNRQLNRWLPDTNQARLQAGLAVAIEVQSQQVALNQAERSLEASQAQAQIAQGISLIGGSQ